MLRRKLAMLTLLLACGKPRSPPVEMPQPPEEQLQEPEPPAKVPEPQTPSEIGEPVLQPLDERLEAEVGAGKSVLLDLREDGLFARTEDGKHRERLVAGEWNAVWPDAQTRTVWLWRQLQTGLDGQDGDLSVLDLSVPLPESQTLATHVPPGLAFYWGKSVQNGPDDARLRLSLDPHAPGFQYRVPPTPGHWQDPPRWNLCMKALKPPVDCPRMATGAEDMLRTLAARMLDAPPQPRMGKAPPEWKKTAIPGCTADLCGAPHTLPHAHWWLVPAAVWSDCCRVGHQLYDPKTKRFLRLVSGHLAQKPSSDRRDTVEFLWVCPHDDAVVTESGVVPLNPPGALKFGDADACLGAIPVRVPSLPCPQGDQCEEESAEQEVP